MTTLARVMDWRPVSSTQDESVKGLFDTVSGLSDLFTPQFSRIGWAERYRLLDDIFDYLDENMKEREAIRECFAQIVERLISSADGGPLWCDEQAHIYAASAALQHRQLARRWFARG